MRSKLACIAFISLLAAGCGGGSPIEVELATPVPPKLNVSLYGNKILVAGLTGPAAEITDVQVPAEIAITLRNEVKRSKTMTLVDGEVDEQDIIEKYNDPAFWKSVGDEYGKPLIITGVATFQNDIKKGFIRQRNPYTGWETVPETVDRQHYTLIVQVRMIDGRNGEQIQELLFREEITYPPWERLPEDDLFAYYELAESVIPSILASVTEQNIISTRTLLR